MLVVEEIYVKSQQNTKSTQEKEENIFSINENKTIFIFSVSDNIHHFLVNGVWSFEE